MNTTGATAANIHVAVETADVATFMTGHANVTQDFRANVATRSTAVLLPKHHAVSPTCTNATSGIRICSHVYRVSKTQPDVGKRARKDRNGVRPVRNASARLVFHVMSSQEDACAPTTKCTPTEYAYPVRSAGTVIQIIHLTYSEL